jgi:transposase
MARYKAYNTGQQYFEVININEELPQDNRARIVKEIVSGMDLSGFDFNYRNDEKGANANDVRMMLGILFLAATRGIRGSRSIAGILNHDLEFKYLLEGAKTPDDSTIRKFRSRHVKEYSTIFAKIVHIACALGMIDFGSLAIDGSKVQAYASLYETKDHTGLEKSIRLLSKRMEDILKRLNDTDDSDERDELKKRLLSIEKRQSVLEDFNTILSKLPEGERVNRVDPDARLMKKSDGKSIIGYNAQAAVESGEHGIIVAAELSQQATDESLLLDISKKAEENCDNEFDTILGDAGYITYESMEQASREGKKILGPDRLYNAERFGKEKKGDFAKSKFCYDGENDCYICPGNCRLELQRMKETKESPLVSEYFNREACAGCRLVSACCSKGSSYRVIHRDYRELLRENMREELKSNRGFLLYGKRSQTVEPSFGNVKQNKGVRQLFYRGREKADAEWKHVCIGINISKIVKFLQGKDWNALVNIALNPA